MVKIEDFDDLIIKKEDNGICTAIISKPEIRNAMTPLTFNEMFYLLDDIENDKNIKVLIITGDPKGNAFTSGAYFRKEMFYQLKKYPEIDLMDVAQKRLAMKFWNFPKPVIFAINGMAIGGGVTIPLIGADLIYMAEDAWFAFYFVKRGIIQEFSSSFLLPFLMGFQKAKELLYFGDKITAQQAEKLGLVNKVLPPDELMPYARDQALRLIPPKGPSISIKLMKKTMHNYFYDILSKVLDKENRALRKTFTTHDFRESMEALKEKRDSVFIGR
jgi:2-(1,2-epoxy-1,2-dihydrophenyl)acetyl-CoA isomerase